MYHSPSEVSTFWQLLSSRENQPIPPLHYETHMQAHLVVMYLHTLEISEENGMCLCHVDV